MFKTSQTNVSPAARIAFGLALIAGAIALVADTLDGRTTHAAKTLLVTWLGAFAAATFVQLVVRGTDPRRDSHVVGWVVPTIGIALVLPLSIHALVALVIDLFLLPMSLDALVAIPFEWCAAFDSWVELSLLIAGPAHVVFVILAATRAHQLASGAPTVVSTGRIFAVTVGVSCIPFAVLFFIPPIVVALTGVAIVPLLRCMPAVIRGEDAVASVPAAIAHYKETAHV